ncbi:TRAP transporter small permease [Lactonifactor longoviformis]|uniref:TRAP-type C4-dicarboxylate transport system, small permease component n=1 Tax=Lactonifactor longoviformis DSM 17459 TaxID=1122155 RepID=A0A1M4XSX5_9CLOT|nr:TRAP transporter small permease [Lactonifactor longoviformis]POP31023.1 TRAP transporter small permease [Lactonifactor longoviformis]SHE96500.1 TRAP-type C4-dicarboxylate transport system, small permease component [Lactonifactor longoviformis DSM 17459]
MDKKAIPHRIYFRFIYILEKIIEWISAVTFLGILAATLLQVLFRYVFNKPLLWTEEIARYLGIFAIMMASSIALKHDQHIGIDFLSSKLPAPVQKWVKAFYALVIMGVMGYLGIYTAILMGQTFFTPTPAMRIPIGIPYLGMFLGYLCSFVFGACILYEICFHIEVPVPEEEA